jgi:hypothetical protein
MPRVSDLSSASNGWAGLQHCSTGFSSPGRACIKPKLYYRKSNTINVRIIVLNYHTYLFTTNSDTLLMSSTWRHFFFERKQEGASYCALFIKAKTITTRKSETTAMTDELKTSNPSNYELYMA